MTTPVWLTGFEHGVSPQSNGGGLITATSGAPNVVNTPVNSGNYAARLRLDGATAQYFRRTHAGTPQIAVFRAYVRINALPSGTWTLLVWNVTTAAALAGLEISSAGVFRCQVGAGTAQSGLTATLNQWYRIDMRLNITTSTWTCDWQIDGVDQTQATLGGQATTDAIGYIRFGSGSSSLTTGICFFDDAILSETSADYPIGAGYTELLVPSSDGTHNAGTNIMENNAGADIGVVTAWNLVDAVPMTGSSTYIRQAAVGAGNYAEVLFGDIQAQHSAIVGADALLAYTSETTSANTAGCIFSKDSFSTHSVLWGVSGSLSDYSDGSLTNLFFKHVILANVNDDTTVNNLKARVGYSGDATPDPYWVNLAVEVAYLPASAGGRKFQRVSVMGV